MSEPPTNGTVETATITLPKFKTLDGRGTCGLQWNGDGLFCKFARAVNFGKSHFCTLTSSNIFPDNLDGTGYLRPCSECPIHNHE